MSDATRLRLTFSLLMSGLMSVLMTGWVSWLNLGFGPDFAVRWGHAFIAAWPAAFSIVLLLAPGVQRFSQRLLARRSPAAC